MAPLADVSVAHPQLGNTPCCQNQRPPSPAACPEASGEAQSITLVLSHAGASPEPRLAQGLSGEEGMQVRAREVPWAHCPP